MPKELVFHRKLAAILAADVVGYSRMMEADEVGTLRRVQFVQRTCITPITASYGGRLIKTTGDGFLFEFSSAVDAILFALAFQKKLQAEMASVAEPKRLVFRVGVHAGDVLSDGADMFGDGVNVAARLETLCVPGGICMSAVVQQQLHGKIDLPLIDLGEHQVKNITRAIHAFGMEAAAIDQIAPVEPGSATPASWTKRFKPAIAAVGLFIILISAGSLWLARHFGSSGKTTETKAFSIAVLPFKSLSNDNKPDDFADALVDNLTTDMSIGFPTLTVISSASAFTYRGKDIDSRQVGHELGAKYLLEGSVQRFSDSFRVNVHLVEAESGAQLWSDQFGGSLSDVGALQDQITIGIANTLSVQLIRIEADRGKYTTNASALDFLFRGSALMMRMDFARNADLAEADFRKALALDPGSLSAMDALASLLAVRYATNITRLDAKLRADSAEALQLLDRVRLQNPRYPGLHYLLGFISILNDAPKEAEDHYRTEIDIDASSASSYAGLGLSLIMQGRSAEAIPLIEKSIRLDPRDPGIAGNYQVLATAYFTLGKYPEAIEKGNLAYDANPENLMLLLDLAAANALQGNEAEAKSRLAQALKLDPSQTIGNIRRNATAVDPAEHALVGRLIDGLKRAGLAD